MTIIGGGGVSVKTNSEKNNNNRHIVAFDGGKKDSKTNNPKLEIEGETLELDGFIMAGETVEGKRVLLTSNVSPDEMTSYLKTLDVVVGKRIESIMDIE